MTDYDSTADTQEHIDRVRALLHGACANLSKRALVHDKSKLSSPEKEAFDELTPRLKELDYGSDEYRACLREMQGAIHHHYGVNSHHPEHYPNGVSGMSLLDVIEMLMDWKAASERHSSGDIWSSLEHNHIRFELSEQLSAILANTAKELGW